jgi:hypothetical protein
MFPVNTAFIVALSVSSVFFGLAIATTFLGIQALCAVPLKNFTRTRWTLLLVSCAMLVIAAISLGQELRHNLNAFVYYKGGTASVEELSDPRDPTNTIHVRLQYCENPSLPT